MNCSCPIFDIKTIAPLSYGDYFNIKIYDIFGNYVKILNNVNEEDTSQCEYLCPEHHPFFFYLSGMLHLQFYFIKDIVIHAYIYKPTRNLKIIITDPEYSYEYDTFVCCVYKAWNLFNCSTHLQTEVFEYRQGVLFSQDINKHKVYHANKNIIKRLTNDTFNYIDTKI